MILIYFTIVLFILYALVIIIYTFSWFSIPAFLKDGDKEDFNIFVSIIIPMRNEERNIIPLLLSLTKQKFPRYLFELVIVDDDSTDGSVALIESFRKEYPDLLLQIISNNKKKDELSFKKKAIANAIKVSAGELIITLDADVVVGSNWLLDMVSYYLEKNPKMIVGPVSYFKETSLFEKLQSLEFLSLVGVTAGSIGNKTPLMCNGANLAYPKEVFENVGGFEGDQYTSGDDIFLLLKIKEKYGADRIHFLKSQDAIVRTTAKPNLKEFLEQRARWASKNKSFHWEIIRVAILVFALNFVLVLLPIVALFVSKMWIFYLAFLVLKILIDFPLTYQITKFTKKTKLLKYFVLLSIIYPYYIVVSAIGGMFGKFTWKERTYSK